MLDSWQEEDCSVCLWDDIGQLDVTYNFGLSISKNTGLGLTSSEIWAQFIVVMLDFCL
jgi:hypothetical protein